MSSAASFDGSVMQQTGTSCVQHMGAPGLFSEATPAVSPPHLGYQDLDICIQYICSGLVQSTKNDSVVDSS